jgi:hypothetical protein
MLAPSYPFCPTSAVRRLIVHIFRLLPLLARLRRHQKGGACPLRPGRSDVNLLRDFKGVVDLDAEISDCALDLRVPQQ